MKEYNKMKIRLKNIKCYEDSSFDFGEDGLALLTGASGKGKSSIIQGIHFALFGSGSKIQSFGKTSCSVELEFDGVKVVRSKGPCKLLVTLKDGIEIEDDEAQQSINKMFGDAFEVTGYIPQNAVKSFILMSATDKLSFLETFAFQGTDLIGMKKRCKDHLQTKHMALTEATAKLEAIVEVAGEIEEPEWMDFPIPVKNNNFDKAIKNERIRLKNTQVRKRKRGDELIDINEKMVTVKHNLDELSRVEAEIKEVERLISNVVVEDVEEIRKQIEWMEQNRERTHLNQIKSDLVKMKQTEDEENKKVLEEAESELWLTYEEDEVKEMIADNQTLVNDLLRIQRLRTKLGDESRSKEELEEACAAATSHELSKSYHKCPKCTTMVRFEDGKLTEAPPTPSVVSTESRNTLERKLQLTSEIDELEGAYEGDLPELEDTKNDLQYLKTYLSDNQANQSLAATTRRKIDKGIYSSSVSILESKVAALEESLPVESGEYNESGGSEKEMREALESSDANAREVDHLKSRLSRLLTKQVRYKSELEASQSTDVEARRIELVEEVRELEEKLEVHLLNCQELDKWEKRRDELSEFNTWNEKIRSLEEIEAKRSAEYKAVLELRDKILEAESIAMVNLVGSINTHARVYLDDFFEEDPIVVTLTAFKKTKTGVKPQISMDIEYKGMECDLQMLSGGEMSRIVLAYTLALAEMFNSPLLLLDECTSSLDQDTTNHVFDSIKDNFNGKLTIIVAHQVVTGIFDRTVNL